MARFLKSRKKSHGQAAGSLVFIGNQKMTTSRIRLIKYGNDHILEKKINNFEEIEENLDKNLINWINIDGLQDIDLIEKTGKLFTISSLELEDILNTDQRPKLIENENNITVFCKAVTYNTSHKVLESEQITFVIGKNYLVTFQEREGDYFEPVRERLRKKIGKTRSSGADYLCYALLDTLVDSYIINIETLGAIIEEQEDVILKHNSKQILEKIYRHKTEISYIRKFVRPVKEIMVNFLTSESPLIHNKTLSYLKDLDDLVIQAIEATDIYYTMISDQMLIYHTNLSNRVNDVMKILTVFASIFIPLTFIAGVYGTNFDFVPELHYKYSYFIMWGIMLLIAGGMLLFFKRKKFL